VSWLPSSDPRHADAALASGIDEEGDATGTADIYVGSPNAMGQFMCTNRTVDKGDEYPAGERTSLSLGTGKWRDSALGRPFTGPTSVDHAGMTFEG
jgi:hypothetical protein